MCCQHAMHSVVVFGAAGYSGLELIRLLAWHPAVQILGASSNQWVGQRVSCRVAMAPEGLAFTAHEALLEASQPGQIAFLATPASVSRDLAPDLLARGLKVIDLSGAFRLEDNAACEAWYGFTHEAPELLDEAHYGLAEFWPTPPDCRLVSNPGCYATAAALSVAPLVKAGLLDPSQPIIMDGKSGTTGAGKKASEALLYSEVGENLRPYRIGRHQHTPEIELCLSRLSRTEVKLAFTAHLIPMRRGLLVSAYAALKPGVGQTEIDQAYAALYRDQPMIRLSETPVETAECWGNNLARIHVQHDPRTGWALAFCAIDNLVKGAAGQAIQNMNGMLGLPLSTGLLPPGAA